MLPEVETERLILKPRTLGHFDACVEMDIDPDVHEYLAMVFDGGPEHIAFLSERIQRLYPPGLGYWSIFTKAEPEVFIGWVHLVPHKDDQYITEIGWRLKRSIWGNGYATESAQRILAYAFEIIGSKMVIAETHAENIRSMKVMERLGFTFTHDFIYDGRIPSKSYTIRKDEYYNKQFDKTLV